MPRPRRPWVERCDTPTLRRLGRSCWFTEVFGGFAAGALIGHALGNQAWWLLFVGVVLFGVACSCVPLRESVEVELRRRDLLSRLFRSLM